MRSLVILLLALAAIPSLARAQDERIYLPPEVKKVHVGFQGYDKEEQTAYKVGLWTPVLYAPMARSASRSARTRAPSTFA